MWIATDRDGYIGIYNSKPRRCKFSFTWIFENPNAFIGSINIMSSNCLGINLPKWDDEPIEVEIKIKQKCNI